MRVDVSPTVKIGARYVFILSDVRDVAGKSLLDLQEAKFAWPVDAAGTVQSADGPQSLDALTAMVTKATTSPQP
jgi:hypothetical protein